MLKTPQELAEYGPNGVNGVVVITTKQKRGTAETLGGRPLSQQLAEVADHVHVVLVAVPEHRQMSAIV